MKTCVIFGGTGFIGSHLALYLINNALVDHVVLADIKPIRSDFTFDPSKVSYANVDVRTPISSWDLPNSVDMIANFAAVHREPGHQSHEYYETNLPGADNVCAWAEKVGCNSIIFTSSIAPYGPSEDEKTEESIPTPVSAYGGSKLAAEKIHTAWQKANQSRRLVIVRPGVVFGPGEGGNVTRLVKATLKRYFFYMGNRATRKSGGYVKELVNTMWWALNEKVPAQGGIFLYNFTMKPPSVEEYVNATCQVAGVSRFVPSIPFRLLLIGSYCIEAIARPFGISTPISPVRIKKLVRSNNIQPYVLTKERYPFKYTLETAFADWKNDRPEDWKV